jgi:signal transduction histidine kinase
MDRGIKLRLTLLLLGLALFGGLIVAVTLNSQRQASELRARLSQLDLESFGIADHFRESLREVNDKMRAYRLTREPPLWEDFLKMSKELDKWIDDQAPKLKTFRERQILKQIDTAYDVYTQLALKLHECIQAFPDPSTSRAEATVFFDQSRRLSDLGQALFRAHYDSRNELLARANRTLSQLRLSVLWLLALLFLCGLALGLGVYRHLIAPLRVRLVENQAVLERNEKLASLGMLAAGVAHEIRNPLTAMKAAVYIQQRSFQPGTREYVDGQVVEREILRLERIVTNFLHFARPAEPELKITSAQAPLQEVEELLGPELAKADIQLIREDSSSGQVKVDTAQIKQVLINLIQNAADSIGCHGTIALRVRHDRKHLTNGEIDVVILEVADSGKGISPEVEKRLFDPFFTTKENGTGLGLSIAAQIIKKHGGALQYQTQLNRGTTFGIVLPELAA